MKSKDFIKQFEIWLAMENILDYTEHHGLSDDCEINYPIGAIGFSALEQDPFSEDMHHEQIHALRELRKTEVIYYSDLADKFSPIASVLSLKKAIQVKSKNLIKYTKIFQKYFIAW